MSDGRRERLEAGVEILWEAFQACESNRDKPALWREYRATLAELDALPVAKEVSAADDIAERRRIRQAGSHRKARPAS